MLAELAEFLENDEIIRKIRSAQTRNEVLETMGRL